MTEKELKKLSRSDLLELLITEVKENERLSRELAETREKLNKQEINIASYGTLAEAALAISGIFKDAQAAADIYISNLKRISEEQERKKAETSHDGEVLQDPDLEEIIREFSEE